MGGDLIAGKTKIELRKAGLLRRRLPFLETIGRYELIVVSEPAFWFQGGSLPVGARYISQLVQLCRILAGPGQRRVLVCFEPTESSARLKQRCVGGALAQRIAGHRGTTSPSYADRAWALYASSCSTGSSSSSSNSASSSSSTDAGSDSSSDSGAATRGDTQQASRIVFNARTLPVLRRCWTAQSRLPWDLRDRVKFCCCAGEDDVGGPEAAAAWAAALGIPDSQVLLLQSDGDAVLLPYGFDAASFTGRAISQPDDAHVHLTRTSVVRASLLGGLPAALHTAAGVIALAVLGKDSGFRQQGRFGPATVFKALGTAAATLQQPAQHTLSGIVSALCKELSCEKLAGAMAGAVLGIVGQLVVVPTSPDFSRVRLQRPRFVSEGDLKSLWELAAADPAWRIHDQLQLQQQDVAAAAVAAATSASAMWPGAAEEETAGQWVKQGLLALLPGACVDCLLVQRAFLRRGLPPLAELGSAAPAAEPGAAAAAAGPQAAAAEAALACDPGLVRLSLLTHAHRLRLCLSTRCGAAASALGLLWCSSLELYHQGQLLGHLPIAREASGVRAHQLLIISDWEAVRRSLLLQFPGREEQVVVELRRLAPDSSRPGVPRLELQLAVGGVRTSYDTASVAAALRNRQQRAVEAAAATAAAAAAANVAVTVVAPFSWQPHDSSVLLEPPEQQLLGLPGCDLVALWQSDGGLVDVGVVSKRGLLHLEQLSPACQEAVVSGMARSPAGTLAAGCDSSLSLSPCFTAFVAAAGSAGHMAQQFSGGGGHPGLVLLLGQVQDDPDLDTPALKQRLEVLAQQLRKPQDALCVRHLRAEVITGLTAAPLALALSSSRCPTLECAPEVEACSSTQMRLTGSWAGGQQSPLHTQPSACLLPAAFCLGSGLSRSLGTGKLVFAALYSSGRELLALVPAARGYDDEPVLGRGASVRELSARSGTPALQQFRQFYDFVLGVGCAAALSDEQMAQCFMHGLFSLVPKNRCPLQLRAAGSTMHPTRHICAMDAVLSVLDRPLDVRFSAAPVGELQPREEQLRGMGLYEFVTGAGASMQDVCIIPLIADVLLVNPGGGSQMVDMWAQLQRLQLVSQGARELPQLNVRGLCGAFQGLSVKRCRKKPRVAR